MYLGCPVWLRFTTVTSQSLNSELSHGYQSPPPPPPHLESGPGTCPHSGRKERAELERQGTMKRWKKHTPEKKRKLPYFNRLNYASNTCQKECSENVPKQLLLTAKNVSVALCYWLVNSTNAFKFHIKYWLKPSPKDGCEESTWANWGSRKRARKVTITTLWRKAHSHWEEFHRMILSKAVPSA